MNLSPEGEAFIKDYEKLALTCYQDSAGFWTVGFGHRIPSDQGTITEDDAETYFLKDVSQIEDMLDFFNLPMSQQQFDALTSFAFNLGVNALRNSTLLKKFKTGDIGGAAEEFVKWDHAGGVELEGLKKRRLAEKNIFLNGIYDSSH